MSGICWHPFDHSEGQFSLNAKESQKSLEMGGGGQKSQERVKNELKTDFF